MWPKRPTLLAMLSIVIAVFLSSPVMAQASKKNMRPWDMLKDPAYERAHRAMLGSNKYLPWITKLECTAGPGDVEQTKVGEEDWLLLRCCKPDWCSDFVVVLYSRNRGVAYGTYRKDYGQYYLGQPPKDIKSVLDDYERNGY